MTQVTFESVPSDEFVGTPILIVDTGIAGQDFNPDVAIISTLELTPGGQIIAGEGTTLDGGGLKIAPADTFENAAIEASYKVAPPSEFAALWFFEEIDLGGANPYKGAILRTDGNYPEAEGMPSAILLFCTDDGDLNASPRASVQILSGKNLTASSSTHVFEVLQIGANSRLRGYTGNATTISNGATVNFPHGRGSIPWWVIVQYSTDSGVNWRPISNYGQWTIEVNATNVKVTNNSGSSAQVRLQALG